MTLIDEIIAVAGVLFFAVCLIWEPVQTFWRKNTLREDEHGFMVIRDYTPLREWAGGVVRLLGIVAIYWVLA